MADENDDDYTGVAAMADRLKLKGRERDKYIHNHMTGLGYRMQPSYVPADDDDDDDDGNDDRFFDGRARRTRTRRDDDDDDRPRRRRRSGGSDGWYD